MKFDPQKIADRIKSGTGKEVIIGVSGNRSITFTFIDEDLTPAERQAVVDALPPFVNLFYSFDGIVVEVPDGS